MVSFFFGFLHVCSLACVQDLYLSDPNRSNHGHSDPEAQPYTQPEATSESESIIIVPPASNVSSTGAVTVTQAGTQAIQPTTALRAPQQSLGRGQPPVIRQSDSVRRQVTPIPSGQFSSPPILDYNSESESVNDLTNENPPSPDPPVEQLPAPASASGPSKRGKTGRGSKRGGRTGRGGGRQRAKATATATTSSTTIE
jgi:hypothetical protein